MERFLASVLSTVGFLARNPKEVGLEQYLELLKAAPGATMAEKVEFLSSLDVQLSKDGMRRLQGRRSLDPLLGFTPGAGTKHWA
jgi:hypothetical protein